MISDEKAEKYGNRKWRTRDGTVVLWKDMELKHLRNAAAMIRRNYESLENKAWTFSAMVQGDMASMYADQAVNQAIEEKDAAELRAQRMEAYAKWREVHPDLPENVFYV